jgi:hypothetical protein
MSILQKTFEKMLAESSDYSDLKNRLSSLTDSVNELAQSIVSITQTLQAHHVVLGEMLAFQRELVKSLNDPLGPQDPFEDESKLN